jgi:hypothetical protein
MSKYSLELTIPFLPMSYNKALSTHFQKRSDSNECWDHIVHLYSRGKKPLKPLGKVKLTLVRYNYRTLDFDGLVASFKAPIDAMVTAGILKNDTWKITGKWDVDQKFLPKSKAPFITIKVEEISMKESQDE